MSENQLTLPQRAQVALGSSEHEQHLLSLVETAKTITEIKNVDARHQCHAAYMTLKNARVAIANTGKAAREDAQAFAKAVINEEKRLIGITEAEEERLQKLRDDWDAAREAERQEKIRIERERVAIIHEKISAIRNAPLNVMGKKAAEIEVAITNLQQVVIDESTFAEFTATAASVHVETLERLHEALRAAQLTEAESARIKAERDALAKAMEEQRIAREAAEQEVARQQAELDRQRREQEERMAEESRKVAAEIEAARAKIAEERAALEAERLAAQKPVIEPVQEVAQIVGHPPETIAEVMDVPAFLTMPESSITPRPTDMEIISFLSMHFRVSDWMVVQWIKGMDLNEVLNEIALES